MSAPESSAALSLPDSPDLRHLRDQARDLVRAGEMPTLAKALFAIARRYGFASWPKLKAEVESRQEAGRLKQAIDTEDWSLVREMMTRNPKLHRAPLGYAKNGPLTWLAECRVPRKPPTPERLEMAEWMIANGSDIHQGGDGPLMRAALDDERIPMVGLLVARGADVNALWNGHYPIILAPCEALAPQALRWLLEHGTDPEATDPKYGRPLPMLIGTYSRNAKAKQACLNALAERGYTLPDTPPMAVHMGRLDLLDEYLRRDPSILARQYSQAEIFPPEIGMKPEEGLTSTSLDGATLLHMAVEWADLDTARWLLEHGADPNVRAAVDTEGFGGQTPLFHTAIIMGRQDDTHARLLLEYSADPNARATFRKQLQDMGDPEKESVRTFRDVTPTGYAYQYTAAPQWANAAALAAIAERGGTE